MPPIHPLPFYLSRLSGIRGAYARVLPSLYLTVSNFLLKSSIDFVHTTSLSSPFHISITLWGKLFFLKSRASSLAHQLIDVICRALVLHVHILFTQITLLFTHHCAEFLYLQRHQWH
ncbi:hypothetical protein E2C01_010558 [Portunus trituberculatus]|uniref:Uncharacterized protein n=1 Tax=Portunus trituberculatus TaxID=210409 RepID=A0A5B7D8Z1_PORTR|nr:hypothetical protein [Portunus trituberculatus]